MDRICQYSTIIFAGNMSVLLFVAIMTDYWEYRSFHAKHIQDNIPRKNKSTRILFPRDTDTYFIIKHAWDARVFHSSSLKQPEGIEMDLFYQPPALLKKYYYFLNVTLEKNLFNGTHNYTEVFTEVRVVRYKDELVLFVEYGNMFRNCDDLEVGVRKRLGLIHVESERCFNFITSFQDRDFIERELPAVIHLERTAFAFSLMCLVSSVVSVVTGAYGSLAQDKETIIAASSSALVSAMTLIITIALFHGKCHLMHRREFMKGIDIPYKQIVNESRQHYYGWSFVLAWICVVLCFVHSWVWLLKAQNIPEKYTIRRGGNSKGYAIRSMSSGGQGLIDYAQENSGMVDEDDGS